MAVTKLYKRTVLALLTIAALVVVQAGVTSAAGSATLSLSPSSGSHLKGTNFTVTIHENSGSTGINAVEADLTYDQTKLQFISIDTTVNTSFSGSNGTCPSANGGSGSVKVACAKYSTTLTGDQTVASVTFKAIGTGTANVPFASSSAIIKPEPGGGTSNVWDGNTKGGTYSLTSSSTSGGTTTPTKTNTTTTTKPKTSSGGTTSKTGSSAKSKATVSTTPTLTTYLVAIRVEGLDKKPVKNAKVTLDNQPASLFDIAGIASFSGVSAGSHTVVASAEGKQVTKTIVVLAGNPTTVQQYDLTLPIGKKSNTAWIVAAALILIIILIGGGIAMRRSPRQDDHNYEPPSGNDTGVSVGPLPATVIPADKSGAKVVTADPSINNGSLGPVIHPDPDAQKNNHAVYRLD